MRALALEGQLLARLGPKQMGRVGPLCPGTSDLNLLDNGQAIIDLDPKVADGTSVKIAGPPID